MYDPTSIQDALRAADEVVAKALGMSEMSQIAKAEVRLRTLYIVEWEKRAEKAAKAAGAAMEAGKSAKQISSAVDKIMSTWAGAVEKSLTKELKLIYNLARKAGWKKATKQTKAELVYNTPHVEPVKKAAAFTVDPVFDLVDEEAFEALNKQQLLWTGRHYSKNVSGSIAKTTQATMVARGMGRRAAGLAMAEAMRKELGKVVVPGGFMGSERSYFEGLAANAATVARSHGNMRSYIDAGVTKYEITNPSDERTCPTCGHMAGKVFTTKQGAQQMHDELKADTPEEVKSAHPWLTPSQMTAVSPTPGRIEGEKGDKDSQALADKGQSLPPFHFRCRCGTNVSEEIGSWDPGEKVTPPTPKTPPRPAVSALPTGNWKPAHDYGPMYKDTWNHPIPTGPINMSRLASGLKIANEGRLTTRVAVGIRRETNALLSEYNMVSRDLMHGRRRAGGYVVGTSKARYLGTHASDTGVIMIREEQSVYAAKFANGNRSAQAIKGMQTLVHEAVHGHSPLAMGGYQGYGLVMEEATTELASRKIVMDKFGIEYKRINKAAYTSYINKVKKSVKSGLPNKVTEEELDNIVLNASITMRQNELSVSREKFVTMFADEVIKHAGVAESEAFVARNNIISKLAALKE